MLTCAGIRVFARCATLALFAGALASPALAQSSAPAAPPAVSAQDDDGVLDPAEPEFRIINLPTTARLPRWKGNFSLTHRFAGNFRRDSFGTSLNNLFGIDEGATVGLEYRIGIARHLEAVAYRTSFNRTIQLSAKYDALHQSAQRPLSLSVVASDEGIDNFQEQFAPALGAVLSHEFGTRAAVYAVPTWVHNSAAVTGTVVNTTFVGLGARVRLRPTVYVAAEASPRASGYRPGTRAFAFAIEKRAGGHMFQLNFSNTAGSTPAQIARGGAPHSLSLGFNLSRKFF
ncbi:MAG: DUF5777 family beta-barrel protein [Vicinamibacterales bacterium]|mgnify:CR=1 FL=1